jgi:DNA-binding CsgD family transcriptional regulator
VFFTSRQRHERDLSEDAAAQVQRLRNQALQADQARAAVGGGDWETAINVWQDLVGGPCSLVDAFESGGRLFVLAKANGARAARWRGLTPRESGILFHAASGESLKATSYRLGLSRSRISFLVSSIMRKLGVKTQAQLVLLMRGFHR